MAGFKIFLSNLLASFVVYAIVTPKGGMAVGYCVKPDTDESLCSEIPACAENCYILEYYIEYSNKYSNISSNTTFLFLPGDHDLSNSTLIANVSSLSLTSSELATIKCSYFGGLSFFNITNLTIEGLKIVNCENPSRAWNHASAALEITLVYNLVIRSLEIHNTTGYGLMLTNVYGYSSIVGTTIVSSHCSEDYHGGNLNLYWNNMDQDIMYHGDSVLLVKDSHFLNGTDKKYASGVLVEIIYQSKLKVILKDCTMIGNKGVRGGNVGLKYEGYSSLKQAVVSIQDCNISSGQTYNTGGGLYGAIALIPDNNSNVSVVFEIPALEVINTHFELNVSPHLGAAVYLRLHEAFIGVISFNNCVFARNTLNYFSDKGIAGHGGVAVHILSFQLPPYERHATLLFTSKFINCIFTRNEIKHTAPSFESSRNSALFVQNIQSTTISNCSFTHNMCTGIIGINSNLMLDGYNLIQNHTGTRGGGIVFCSGAKMYLKAYTILNITQNNASQYGGGIFVEDDCSQVAPYCFFQVDSNTWNTTAVYLIDNYATLAGSAVYGGLITHCLPYKELSKRNIFNSIFHISGGTKGISTVSSNPTTTCFCKNGTFGNSETICSYSSIIEVVPGSSFQIRAVLVGQYFGPVPGVVNTECIGRCSIPVKQQTQTLQSNQHQCPTLNYTVFADEHTIVKLQLIAEDSYYQYSSYTDMASQITVHVQGCPLGFVSHCQSCVCLVHRSDNTIKCNITTMSIIREPPVWIGFLHSSNKTSTDIIFHEFCPLNYCIDDNVIIETNATYFDQDAQCSQQRTGLLCGKCTPMHSLQFGSSTCTLCDQNYLRIIGLILLCAVAGILLVLLLIAFNLTVSDGVLNGLIFYANVIQVNKDIFFPRDRYVHPLTTFIAWMNLDFGIEVCFYQGMDTFGKTWLQCVFPLYIWILSAGVIYCSRKSYLVSKLAGRNAVKVLATLFLLSFGKLSRVIITAGSVTTVKSISTDINRVVWLSDANLDYMKGRHISLFIFACVAGMFTLLYAFALTFIQCLRKTPNNILFSWVQRFKPLLDAYTGPYKDNYHFWTGLLLLIRVFLFISFALNVSNNPTINLTLIIATCSILLIAIQPGIYQNMLLGIIESSLYVNLIVFSTVTMDLMSNTHTAHKYRVAAVYVFVGLALVTFLAIVFIYGCKQLFGLSDWSTLKVWCREFGCWSSRATVSVQPILINTNTPDSDDSEQYEDNAPLLGNTTIQEVQLREPLVY